MKPVLRFYCTGFLSSGSNLLHLLEHVDAWIMDPGTVRVVFSKQLASPSTVILRCFLSGSEGMVSCVRFGELDTIYQASNYCIQPWQMLEPIESESNLFCWWYA